MPNNVLELLVAVETNISGLNQVTVGVPHQRVSHDATDPCYTIKQCSWTHKLRYLGADYFPSLVIETECAKCDEDCVLPMFLDGNEMKQCTINQVSNAVTVLKRTQSNGYDNWERYTFPDNFIGVGCQCKLPQ